MKLYIYEYLNKIWKLDLNCLFNHNKDLAEPLHEIKQGHTKTINIVRYSPDGKYIATGSDDCSIIIWEEKTRPKFFGSAEDIWSWGESRVFL